MTNEKVQLEAVQKAIALATESLRTKGDGEALAELVDSYVREDRNLGSILIGLISLLNIILAGGEVAGRPSTAPAAVLQSLASHLAARDSFD